MYGYIYKTTNIINNKIYIGQHKSGFFDKGYLGSGKNITRAIKKYGKENFSVELIKEVNSPKEADDLERHYIGLYESSNPSIGYNISHGGQERFFTGLKHSDSSKRKMREKKVGKHPKPTTLGKLCYTNGTLNKMISEDEVQEYESIGWYRGKTYKQKPVAWNKGLTKETDKRVEKYSLKRQEVFENGGSIGCFGVVGNTNGFKKGMKPWNKGLKHYNDGHPNYYHGKNKNQN